MGQRHQLFIIAKVGKRHRCLAAMHHQWLYGERAVDVASRLQLIFQSPANRHALSCELIEAYKKSDKFWDDAEKTWQDVYQTPYAQPIVPFSYVMTCLIVGASFNPETRYNYAMPHIGPFGMPFDGGDNNDGITVIDITKLSAVKYCFVFLYSSTQDDEIPMMPLSAARYNSAYGNYTSAEAWTRDEALIDAETLNSVWPDRGWGVPKVIPSTKHHEQTVPQDVVDVTQLLANVSKDQDILNLNSLQDLCLEIKDALLAHKHNLPEALSIYNIDITTSQLTWLLTNLSNLRALYLNSSTTSSAELHLAKAASHLNLLYSPSLCDPAFKSIPMMPWEQHEFQVPIMPPQPKPSAHYWPIAQIINGLIVNFTSRKREEGNYTSWSSLAEEQQSTTGNHLVALPVADALYTGAQWLTALRHFMAMSTDWRGLSIWNKSGGVGVILAKALALSADSLHASSSTDLDVPVRALPGFLYSHARSMLVSSGTPNFESVMPSPGMWTIVLLNTVDLEKVKGKNGKIETREISTPSYCFLRTKENAAAGAGAAEQSRDRDGALNVERFEMHDFPSFLASLPRDECCTLGDGVVRQEQQLDFWNNHMFRDQQTGWKLCAEDIVADVLDCANRLDRQEREHMQSLRETWGGSRRQSRESRERRESSVN